VIILVVALGFSAALATIRITSRIRVPAPAIYLLAAAMVAQIAPRVGRALSTENVVRIGTVALIVILFDGGMGVGEVVIRARAAGLLGEQAVREEV
jgi:potassium/hydrogen antiporter